MEEIAVGIVYLRQQEDDNVKKRGEMIIVKYFFNAVATVDILISNSNDETSCQNSICTFCMTMKSSYLFNRKKITRPRFLVSLVCPPEIQRDIAFMPSILVRVQRWRVS